MYIGGDDLDWISFSLRLRVGHELIHISLR